MRQAEPQGLHVLLPTLACLVAGVTWVHAQSATAGCKIELATYGEPEAGARVEFMPTTQSAVVTNTFKMLLENNVVLDGIVMWTEGVRRSNGMLMYKCPAGDVTGDEIAACTVWQGVIYASDQNGVITTLPAEGSTAPDRLLFADLGPALAASSGYGPGGFRTAPWEVFSQNGCQE